MKSTRWKLQALKLAGLSASILLFATACGETGSDGNLRFADQTGADDNSIIPIAEGRKATYKVTGTAINRPSREVESATSSDESVLTVNHNGSKVTVHGQKPGVATVEVLATNGTRDRLELEVREEANSYYLTKELATSGALATGIVDVKGKYNLHSTDTRYFHDSVFVDKDGVRLSGAGVVGLGTAEVTGTMKSEFNDQDASVSVTAGADGDTAALSNPYGSDMLFRTKDALEPVAIVGFRYAFPIVKNIQTGPSFRLPEGFFSMHFMPVDDDGYRYIGAYNLKAKAELSDATNLTVTYVGSSDSDTDYCAEKNADDRCVKWENLPDASFNFIRGTSSAESSATFTITMGSVSEDFTLTLPKN